MVTETFITFAVVLILTGVIAAFLYKDSFLRFISKPKPEDPNALNNLYKSLRKFSRLLNFEVIEKTTLEYNGETYTFDALLLGYFGTLGFKVCNKNGDIYADSLLKPWVQIHEDKRVEFISPFEEMGGGVKFIKEIYRAEKLKTGTVETFITLAGKTSNLITNKAISQQVFTLKTLIAHLNGEKYMKDNSCDIALMKEAIAKYKKG